MLLVSLSALSWLGKFSALLANVKFQTVNMLFNTILVSALQSLWPSTSSVSPKHVQSGSKTTHFQDSWPDLKLWSSKNWYFCIQLRQLIKVHPEPVMGEYIGQAKKDDKHPDEAKFKASAVFEGMKAKMAAVSYHQSSPWLRTRILGWRETRQGNQG